MVEVLSLQNTSVYESVSLGNLQKEYASLYNPTEVSPSNQ
jgi:hypothetical protein